MVDTLPGTRALSRNTGRPFVPVFTTIGFMWSFHARSILPRLPLYFLLPTSKDARDEAGALRSSSETLVEHAQ